MQGRTVKTTLSANEELAVYWAGPMSGVVVCDMIEKLAWKLQHGEEGEDGADAGPPVRAPSCENDLGEDEGAPVDEGAPALEPASEAEPTPAPDPEAEPETEPEAEPAPEEEAPAEE